MVHDHWGIESAGAVLSTPAWNEAIRERDGWMLIKGPDGKEKWVPVPSKPSPRAAAVVDLKDLDETLDASHKRMSRALAVETLRLEQAAIKGALSGLDIESLGKLSQTWRTLVQNEPTADYGDMTDEQIKAKLAEVKRR